jgi:ATP-dependent helicase HrpA
MAPERPALQTPALPVLERRAEIEALVRAHQTVVLCGETGSGKTTQLPQICLDLQDAGLIPRSGAIAHTQPRRLAARAVAARIAEERASPLGALVGYKVRFEDRTSRATRIKVLTDGSLLAELSSDPDLRAYSVVIIDEAHERSLNIDFLLGYLRRLLPRRPDLKLIVTSATIDPARFSDFFGGKAVAPVIEVSGRMFPVDVRYAGDDRTDDFGEVTPDAVADAVEDLASPARPGDVLVFLPGEREIRLAADALARRRIDADILPLYSRLSNAEQDRVFHTGPRRRVVLATNVAETSLTVPGIRFFVDTGLARISRYDAARKVQTLPIEPVSRASANQRTGRCGRVAAGVCVRLYSERSYAERPAFTPPEIRRTSLAGAILQMVALRLGPIEAFPFIDPPEPAAIRDGYETLFELGAITRPDADGTLTPIGQRMAKTPLDPRIARMVLAASDEGSLAEVVVLAAALSIQDPRERPGSRQESADRAHAVFRDPSSDFLTLLKLYEQCEHAYRTLGTGAFFAWCRESFVSAARVREWIDLARQLRSIAEELKLRFNTSPATPDAVHRALLTGLISNLACRDGDAGSFEYRGIRGNAPQIFPGSVLFKKAPKWIVAAEMVETSRLYARTVARVEPEWIEDLAAHVLKRQLSDPHFDPDTGRASAWERLSMSGVVVVPRRRVDLAKVDPAAARALFLSDGLATGRVLPESAWARHNAAILAAARAAEGKLRQRSVVKTPESLAALFAARLPVSVHDPATLSAWIESTGSDAPLRLALADVLAPGAARALDPALFPDTLELPSAPPGTFTYALAPGKDDDGVTLTLPLAALAAFDPARAAWLVPGLLPDVLAAIFKTLPKTERMSVEALGPPAETAASIAGVMDFAGSPLSEALSETFELLHHVKIPPAAWQFKGLPAHLRLRIRVVDDHAKALGEDRDVAALLERFAGRIKKLQADRRKNAYFREHITDFSFGDLPRAVTPEPDAPAMFPALVDVGDSCTLTLLSTAADAELHTARGVRRLFALACAEECGYVLDALPNWSEMTRQHKPLGEADELRDALVCLACERTFQLGQAPVLDRDAFESRLAGARGKLAANLRDTAEQVARILDARAKVAHRLASGTPRLWADSIADIREHATYLMPRGFLLLTPWAQLRRFPTYAEAMRARLFALREDGSKAETDALRAFAPHWKRFTGWVAHAMAAERAAQTDAGTTPQPGKPTAPRKAPLPQTRRTGAAVNVDAGEWAAQPGNLPPPITAYRWALEDLRVAMFTPTLAGKPAVTPAAAESLWTTARST